MNQQISNYASNYFETFCDLFEITSDGNLNTRQENLQRIEDWFNQSYLTVSLITAVPLTPLHFNFEIGIEAVENQKILMHIYSVSYTSLHYFCRILKKKVPLQFCPAIVSI
jgi:hypothetical protein